MNPQSLLLAWISVAQVLTGNLPPSTPLAQDGATLDGARAASLKALVSELEELADWCRSQRLSGLLSRVYELLIEVDADHKRARSFLGYRLQRGVWVAPKKPTDRKDVGLEHLEQGSRLLAGVLARYRAGLHAQLLDPDLSESAARELEERILRLDANDRVVQRRRGLVPFEGGWMMADTLGAMQRRAALELFTREELANASAGEGTQPRGIEGKLNLDFQLAMSPRMRVLSSGERAEAMEFVRLFPVATSLFNFVLESEGRLPRNLRLFLLSTESERDIFLESYPGLEPAYRQELKLVTGTGLRGTQDWVIWEGERAKRKDGLLRMAFAFLLNEQFKVTAEQGWLFEGLGIYLTHALVGTRLSTFQQVGQGQLSGAAMIERTDLTSPETNWMQEAQRVLAQWTPKEFAGIFGKSVHHMGRGDLLASYAVLTYLVEARPAALLSIVQQASREASAVQLVTRELGMDLEQLLARLRGWIEESFAEEFTPPIAAAELWASWRSLDAAQRLAAVGLFHSKLDQLNTPQLELMRSLLASAPKEFPRREAASHYSESEHAPGDPIRRKLLSESSSLVQKVKTSFFRAPDAAAQLRSVSYDWATGRVLRDGEPHGPDAVFENAANGFAPGLDLAHALALCQLDGGQQRVLQAAFEHAYTDRDGGVYPGVTLYDAWSSRMEIEMPDVDVLGIYHDITQDWKNYVAPLPESVHAELYGIIESYFYRVRDYRSLRIALADCLLEGEPSNGKFQATRTNMHALWAELDSNLAAAAAQLPSDSDQSYWLSARIERDRSSPKLWEAGRRRRARWSESANQVRQAMAEAIRETLGH